MLKSLFKHIHLSWMHTLRHKSSMPVEKVSFPGAVGGSLYTEKMSFLRDYPTIPTYRVMDLDGSIIVPSAEPQVFLCV